MRSAKRQWALACQQQTPGLPAGRHERASLVTADAAVTRR